MEEQGGKEVSPLNHLIQLVSGTIDSRPLPGSLIGLQTIGIKAIEVEVVYCMMFSRVRRLLSSSGNKLIETYRQAINCLRFIRLSRLNIPLLILFSLSTWQLRLCTYLNPFANIHKQSPNLWSSYRS
jgi:hypothetical protein